MTLKTFLLTTLLTVTGIGQAAAATLTSEVDRERLGASETLELTVQYDGQASSRDMDFSALKADFDLLSALRISPISAGSTARPPPTTAGRSPCTRNPPAP